MKTIVLIILTLFFTVFGEQKLVLNFFGSPTCGECLEIKTNLLFPVQKKNPDIFQLNIYDVDTDSGYHRLAAMEKAYKVKTTSSIMLFLPDTFISDMADIMTVGAAYIDRYLKNKDKWTPIPIEGEENIDLSSHLQEKFQSFTFLSIMIAGLLDGVNPCAIATMIFLISFLANQKRKKGEVLIIGLSFTAAVFVTYLMLGVGAFKALTFLQKYSWVSQFVRWSAVAFAAGVSLYSFRDAWIYKRTGQTGDMTLQLPKAVKLRIHRVISGQLSGRKLIVGAMVTGFLVTLLEAVCTGQMYLPTIILMTRQEGLKITGWLYLLFYNFLFVLPLLIVMVLAYFGLSWNKLSNVTRNNLFMIKILFGVVLAALALFLAFAG
jgi:cytochrome c biogenesis protein CcdA